MNSILKNIALIIVLLFTLEMSADSSKAATHAPIRINCAAIEDMFMIPMGELFYGKELTAIHQSLVRKMITDMFSVDNLAEALNLAMVPREKLFKIKALNILSTDSFTLNMDMKTREIWITPWAFISPLNMAEEINWGIGFLDYQDSSDKAVLNNTIDQYIADSIKLEVARIWLVDDFYQELDQRKLSSKAFKYHLANYLNLRKDELEFNNKSLTGWKQFFMPDVITKWKKRNSDRLDKINNLYSKYIRNTSENMLNTADIELLRGDIITKSFSDCSFYSNSFENIISIYQERNYALLYSLGFGHFYSLRTISAAFICPGYNQFRQLWIPMFGTDDTEHIKISASDFVLTFDKSPSIEENYYLLFSINIID